MHRVWTLPHVYFKPCFSSISCCFTSLLLYLLYFFTYTTSLLYFSLSSTNLRKGTLWKRVILSFTVGFSEFKIVEGSETVIIHLRKRANQMMKRAKDSPALIPLWGEQGRLPLWMAKKEVVTGWESGMDIYTLPNVKQIASGKQPHSTGRSARCFVTT